MKLLRLLLVFILVSGSATVAWTQCNYTLEMNDSWGDGWNGNTMDVLVNGTVVLDDVGLTGGSQGTLTFPVSTGDDVTTVWNGGGAYGAETSYRILDASGTEVGTGAQASITTGTITGACPSCIAPTGLAITALTTTSGTASWTAEATATNGFNWEIVPSGDGQGNNVVTSGSVGVGVNSASVTGLAAGTSYDLYVQSDCGGNGTEWSSAYTFTTLCNAISTLPFVEGFEAASATLSCWRVLDNNNDALKWATYGSNANSGSQSYAIETDFNGGNNDDYLISPGIVLTGNERLRFYQRVQSAGEPNDFTVLLSTTGVSATDFTNTILANASYSNTTYNEIVVDLSAYSGTVYIAFHVPNGGLDGWRLYIDDVTVETIPAGPPNCSQITTPAVSATDVAVTTNLSWNNNIDATGYKLSIGTTTGATDVLNNSDLGNVTTYDPPADLAFGQTYYVTLTAYNANGDATGCTETSFTTTDGCVTVSSPANAATDVNVAASASWTALTGATGYNVSIGTTAGGTDVLNNFDNGAATTYNLTGASLAYSTTYHITVSAYNAAGGATGCTSTSFTTQADPTVTAPWTDDVETHATTTNSTISTNGWVSSPSGTTAAFRWNVDGSGSTPSSSTGPSGANSGVNYFYVEATSGTTGDVADLTSPPINLSGVTTPYLYFNYHMYGASTGTLNIDIYDGTNWNNAIFSITGQQQTTSAAAWREAAVDLSAYSGTIRVRFNAVRGTAYTGDISIDDISVDEAPATPPNCDAAMTSPTNAATNVGTATISWSAATGLPAGYKLQIGTTAGGSEFLAQTDVGNVLTYDPANDFAFNTTYYVTITPYNLNGDATGCTEYSFTTTNGCVTAITPADAATGVSTTSSAFWAAITGVAGYKVSVGTTVGGTDVANAVDNGTSTNYDMSGLSLAYNTTYYLTIIAYNDAADATGCTSTSFTTGANPNFGGGPDGTDPNQMNSGGYYFANSLAGAGASMTQPTYSWIDPVAAGHTEINSWTSGSDDDGYFTIPDIGFDFPFWGTNYRTSDAHINTNGALLFGANATTATGAAYSTPSTNNEENFIAVCWMDLDDKTNGKIYYGGDANHFVVTWWQYSDYSGSIEYITAQAILYPDGKIVIQYNDTESTADEGSEILADALVGIENATGDKGIQYRNNGSGGPMFGSPMALAFNTSATALPVEMSSFTAVAEGSANVLAWETATEENNAYFDVERSADGVNFETIGQVEGNGTTVEVSEYEFMDENPMTVSYYRLRQVDFDGEFAYSDVKVVKRENATNNTAVFYPVPVSDRLTIDFEATTNEDLNITVTDALGRQVVRKVVRAVAGENQFTVDFDTLPTGTYFIKLQSNNANVIRTIVKK